jgi:mannosyltransferase OCH1-like enzyme
LLIGGAVLTAINLTYLVKNVHNYVSSSMNWLQHDKLSQVLLFIFQIDEDLKEENAKQLLNQEIDLDKPGNSQFYCLHCA